MYDYVPCVIAEENSGMDRPYAKLLILNRAHLILNRAHLGAQSMQVSMEDTPKTEDAFRALGGTYLYSYT